MQAKWIKSALMAALLLSGATAQATVVATDSYGNYDGNSGIRTLNVTQHGTIQDLNITVDFSKCDDPPIGPGGTTCTGQGTSFNNEIVFRLISPDGRVVNLVDAATYSGSRPGAGRVSVTFDDEAATTVGGAVAAGSFQPVGALADFDGIDMFGAWGLHIQDMRRGDPLEYFGSSLDITFTAGGTGSAPVPEPASLAILGLGLLGIGAARRRARG